MVSVWSFFNDLVKTYSIKDKLLRICTDKKKEIRALTAVYYHSLFTKRDSCIQEEKIAEYVTQIEDHVTTGC